MSTAGPFLLDVNVLLALAWPSHVHHAVADSWFADHAEHGWATCPLTQVAFVRLSSNPKFTAAAVSPNTAIEILRAAAAHPHHVFWPDEVSLLQPGFAASMMITGPHQVTDAYLLSLAAHRGGSLTTLDRRLGALIPANNALHRHLVLLTQA